MLHDVRFSIYWQVDNLKTKLFEKLEQSITDIRLNPIEVNNASRDYSAHEVTSAKALSFCILSFSLTQSYLILLIYYRITNLLSYLWLRKMFTSKQH